MATKLRGTIKTLKHQEGFGFIVHAATGEDYFFHRSALERTGPGWDDLMVSMTVDFTPIEAPKGPRAIEVCVVA